METRFKTIATPFILTTLLFVSISAICKQMLTVCTFHCSQHRMVVERDDASMRSDRVMMSVTNAGQMTDHLTTFADLFPSTLTDFLSLLIVVSVFLIVFRTCTDKNAVYENRRRKARIRDYGRRQLHFFRPNFFVIALSRGILHSKVYA